MARLLKPGEKTKLLSPVNLLESLSWEEVEGLARRVPEAHLDRGRILYTPTHRSQILFLLLRGQMRLYKSGEGREITLGVVGPERCSGRRRSLPDVRDLTHRPCSHRRLP